MKKDEYSNPLSRLDKEQQRLMMRQMEMVMGSHCLYNGKKMLLLSSNNYLGLAEDDSIKQAGINAIVKWGNSTSGSRMLNGTNELHVELENKLSKFKKGKKVVIFQSGYMANVGVISALLKKDDYIICDKLVHASIIDGVKLSGATMIVFKHQDYEDLDRKLGELPKESTKLIVVDGVYSMDGDFVDYPTLDRVAKKHQAKIMIDDAHSTGVSGISGRGTAEHFNMSEPYVVTGTLSKAFGCVGGFVCADTEVIDYICFNARSFIYSTSLSPSLTASLIRATDLVIAADDRRKQLWKCTNYLLKELKLLGYNTSTSQTPIIPILFNNETSMFNAIKELENKAIFASPVIYPAVPIKSPRVRISLMATHTIEDMNKILEVFNANKNNWLVDSVKIKPNVV